MPRSVSLHQSLLRVFLNGDQPLSLLSSHSGRKRTSSSHAVSTSTIFLLSKSWKPLAGRSPSRHRVTGNPRSEKISNRMTVSTIFGHEVTA
nr:hypothetical protein Iba_chr10bCG11040 [Ipomoea batatas]